MRRRPRTPTSRCSTRSTGDGCAACRRSSSPTSAYTERTLALYGRMRARYPNAACVVKAYLRRTPADVERLIGLGAGVRLCKGAYQEPPAIAYPDKRDVDAAYARLTGRLLDDDARAAGVYPGFATHDERLQQQAVTTAWRRGVSPDRW